MPTISTHISPADKAASDYCYVPFDVPPGTTRLDVRYQYSHPRHHGDFEGEGNTIDLGLFDPRGHAFGNAAGFRGWSGSDRSHISLGESDADTTPGYLAGPIPTGRWHVILGLYRIAPEGCDYTVTVELTPRAHDAKAEPEPVTASTTAAHKAAERTTEERVVIGAAGGVPEGVATGAAARKAGESAAAAAAGDAPKGVASSAAAQKAGELQPAGSDLGHAAGTELRKAKESAAATAWGPAAMAAGRQTEQFAAAEPEPAAKGTHGAGWYRGDLQAHTHHSDAKGSLATLVATARARGLDFLAVTDHNTVSHIRAFDAVSDGPLLIPAMEVTTYYGHMNVWGIREWVDFRARDVCALRQITAAVHAQGGLASVNHPKTGGPPWEYGDALDFDCIEVWQAPWPFYNAEALAWWESLLLKGRRIVAVGGSDYHQPEQQMQGNPHLPGQPTTWVYAEELSVAGILDGIRRGHVCISADVDGPRLQFSAGGGHVYQAGDCVAPAVALDTLTIHVQHGAGLCARLIADGAVAAEQTIDADDWTHTWPAPAAVRYFRAEVIIRPSPSGWVMAACSNPIYLP